MKIQSLLIVDVLIIANGYLKLEDRSLQLICSSILMPSTSLSREREIHPLIDQCYLFARFRFTLLGFEHQEGKIDVTFRNK